MMIPAGAQPVWHYLLGVGVVACVIGYAMYRRFWRGHIQWK